MVAKASPCYMTVCSTFIYFRLLGCLRYVLCLSLFVNGQYLKDSIDSIINFFESNAGVSQKIALETAAAVQVLFLLYPLTLLLWCQSNLELTICCHVTA